MTEYDYLKEFVTDRRNNRLRDELEPLANQIAVLRDLGHTGAAKVAEANFNALHQEIMEQEERARDIIYRLFWDSKAREEGSGTWPDLYEQAGDERRSRQLQNF